MIVRVFEDEDRQAVYPIIRDYFAYLARARGIPVGVTIKDARAIMRAWLTKPQQTFVFVVEDASEVRGIVRVRLEDEVYTIDDLMVGEAWRGRGYGTALLHFVERFVAEHGGGSVHVPGYPGNLPALDFLIGRGYDRIATIDLRKPLEPEPDHGSVTILGRQLRLD